MSDHHTVGNGVVWQTSAGGYVCLIPCVIMSITDKRTNIAVLLANGKVAKRYTTKQRLYPVKSDYDHEIIRWIRERLATKEKS